MREVRFELPLPDGTTYVVQAQDRWPTAVGTEQVQRVLGPTQWGVRYAQPYDVTKRYRKIRIVEVDQLLQQFKVLGILAHRYVRDVTFFPDYTNAPGTSWPIAWEPDFVLSRVLDQRMELEVTVPELV